MSDVLVSSDYEEVFPICAVNQERLRSQDIISIEKEERLGNNESFPAQSVEKLQAVVLSSTSFASVECVRVVVVLEVN